MSRGSPICGAAGVSRSRPARPAGPPARVAPPRRGGGGRTRRPRGRPPEPVADVTRYGSLAVAARHAALEDPAGLAIADGLVRWTWRELNERVDSVALGLTNAGVEAGDRVVMVAAPTAPAVAAPPRARARPLPRPRGGPRPQPCPPRPAPARPPPRPRRRRTAARHASGSS